MTTETIPLIDKLVNSALDEPDDAGTTMRKVLAVFAQSYEKLTGKHIVFDDIFDPIVRAVLQTLHDNITPEMVEAGWSEIEYRGCKRSDAVETFQAMIQSALKGERA